MKTILLTACLLFLFVQGHYAQPPCGDQQIPTAASLLARLGDKPVYNTRPCDFVPGCNITDTLRKRILYLLHWEWSKQEIADYLRKDIEAHKNTYNIEKRARDIASGDDSLYKKAVDSIALKINRGVLTELEAGDGFVVDPLLVITAARINLREAIPLLQRSLKDTVHYRRWYTELALARLGDKALQRKLIAACAYSQSLNGTDWRRIFFDVFKKMSFIGTQESLYQLHQWIDTTGTYEEIDDRPGVKCGNLAVLVMQDVFLNDEFKALIKGISTSSKSDQQLMAVKQWIIANKGKYTLRKDYCPY